MPSHGGPLTVNADSQVTAKVPTGAVTGKIVVKTKGGSVASKTDFTVSSAERGEKQCCTLSLL